MKKQLIFLLLIALQQVIIAQSKFSITYNQGFGALPTFTNYTQQDLLTLSQANQVFAYVKDSTNIEFKYSYAGCEKRAHAISLLLKAKKIKHYKIWNFDPMLISFFNKSQNPTVISKAGLSPTVSWPYHVAILIFVADQGLATPMVIDPAVSDTLLPQQKWLDLQNAPTSYYTILDPQWYNYATTDKSTYRCNDTDYPPPPCISGLLTGDYFLNEGISLTDMWVEEALAVNELAIKIINGIIKKEPNGSDKKAVFIALVENFNALTAALNGTAISNELLPYAGVLKPYQKQFTEIRNRWKTKLDTLRQIN